MNEYDILKLNLVHRPAGKTPIVVKELAMLCNDKHEFKGMTGSTRSSRSLGRPKSTTSSSFL